MPIYSYTLFKYLKAPSTWIVLTLSMFIAGFLGGWLPFQLVSAHNTDSIKTYSMTVIGVVGGSASFLSIFVSVFAGFKAASMYKDEVEDGTFLIMLSKPRTRSRIIFEKWLALQTAMLIYSFLTIGSFALSIAINDPGSTIVPQGSPISTLSSRLPEVALTMWGVLIVIGFIFTSIALLVSTKASVGATIGITIALGVIIPITSMISMFTTGQKYEAIKGDKLEMSKSLFLKGVKTLRDSMEKVYGDGAAALPSTKVDIDNANKFIDSISDFSENDLYKEVEKVTSGKQGLSDIGVDTSGSDEFGKVYFFDLNYQVKSISSIASDIVIPQEFASSTTGTKWSKLSGLPVATKVTDTHPFVKGNEFGQLIDAIALNIEPIMKAGYQGQELLAKTGLFDYESDYPWLEPKMIPQFKAMVEKAGKTEEVKAVIGLFHSMITSPLTMIIDRASLDDAFDATKFAYKNVNDHVVWDQLRASLRSLLMSKGITDEDVLNKFNISSMMINNDERVIRSELLSIAHYDDQHGSSSFVKVHKEPYANKFSILYIYIAIAVLLVPLSFIIVRRQDFK